MKKHSQGGEMSENLAAAYLGTQLAFDLGEHGEWLLRPDGLGGNPPQNISRRTPPEEIASQLGLEHPALVITASNPHGSMLDAHLNGLRNTRLFWTLKDLGLETHPCSGRALDDSHEEQSFWVPTRGESGIELAVQLEAQRFGQNAIFKVRPGELELVGVEMPQLTGKVPAEWWQSVPE